MFSILLFDSASDPIVPQINDASRVPSSTFGLLTLAIVQSQRQI